VRGWLLDLGVSSHQLETASRGFSIKEEGPLDMRMDQSQGLTAAEMVNRTPERELADLLYRYGEERRSRAVARAIVSARPLRTTQDLARAVIKGIGRRPGSRIHPATRTFQAIRIAVNDELAGLEEFLREAVMSLEEGGRLVAIAFHSLEDRIVKHTLRRLHRQEGLVEVLTPKPVRPSAEESALNPRSRSARLRAVRRTAGNL